MIVQFGVAELVDRADGASERGPMRCMSSRNGISLRGGWDWVNSVSVHASHAW